MASIGISEFTYGYAFLFEQTYSNWGDLRAAPILPSLQQEQHEGWDAQLPTNGTDYYYQFKLSDYLSRSNAKYISDGTYNGPYYRLAFHRRDSNRQHQRLRHHAQTNQHTYYAAPEFNRIEAFNTAFLARQITNRSRIIPIRDCEDVHDGEQHYITFQQRHTGWIQHSEGKRHEKSYTGEDLPSLYRQSKREWRQVNKSFAADLFNKNKAIVSEVIQQEYPRPRGEIIPLLEFDPETAERRDILLRTADILAVTLGVTLVLVGSD
jgi:hypothetical protein